MSTNKPSNIDEYLPGFSVDVQNASEVIRSKDTIPDVEERINYEMPTYTLIAKIAIFRAERIKGAVK